MSIGYIYKASYVRLAFVIFDIRALWSAHMLKITNDGLTCSGTGSGVPRRQPTAIQA